MATPTIVAYLKPSCGWSNGVRAILRKYHLPFEDRDIINVPENFNEMVRKSGQTLQPTLEINGEILADVSGDEVEQFLIAKGLASQDGAPVNVPTNAPCTDEEHARMAAGWSPPIPVK